MTMYPVLLLPFVALAMMIFLPLFGGDKNISKKFRSRKRRKIWLGRLAVFMLLLSTVITLAWPIHGMSTLVQGLLITALVMIPAIVFHLLASLHYGTSSNGFSRWSSSDESEEQWFESDDSKPNADTGSVAAKTSASSRGASSTAIPLSAEAPKDRSSTAIHLGQQTEPTNRSQSIILGSDEDSAIQTSPEVQEQLSQVSKLVQSHDIGGEQDDIDPNIPVVDKPISTIPQEVLNESVDVSDKTALSAMSTQQISALVTTLKEEKGKLQKLVIAQHAVIESEREANVRNRGLARDAIKIMHGAREKQKMAEKMARRERTERQRLEMEYKKVSAALNNAMSIISSRQDSPNPV